MSILTKTARDLVLTFTRGGQVGLVPIELIDRLDADAKFGIADHQVINHHMADNTAADSNPNATGAHARRDIRNHYVLRGPYPAEQFLGTPPNRHRIPTLPL